MKTLYLMCNNNCKHIIKILVDKVCVTHNDTN